MNLNRVTIDVSVPASTYGAFLMMTQGGIWRVIMHLTAHVAESHVPLDSWSRIVLLLQQKLLAVMPSYVTKSGNGTTVLLQMQPYVDNGLPKPRSWVYGTS